MEARHTCTAFSGSRRIAAGSPLAVALALKGAAAPEPQMAWLVFDDETGEQIDFDLRGTAEDIAARYAVDAAAPRKPGRPRLGVVAREVTLLPRHWDWLARQPGGASVALRRLVDEARRVHAGKDERRRAQERAYRFMSAIAGNREHFEEATRALFADDRARFERLVARWPRDVRTHATALAFGAGGGANVAHGA